MSFYSHRQVTTKKAHQCMGCLDIIPIGSKVTYYAGIADGDFCYGYICTECEDVMECDHCEECFEDGVFREGALKDCKICKKGASDE
jgi:hypothetical protein